MHLPQEDFVSYQTSLIVKKTLKHASLLEYSRQLWSEITSNHVNHNGENIFTCQIVYTL